MSVVATLSAADVLVRVTDLGFRPLRGEANADAIVESAEFRTRVRTNALGFREPRLPGPKPPGTRRIVILGDSFTQGYGVEEHEAYPRQLERLLAGSEVINLGVPSACPLDYVAHLDEVGRAYEPDVVVVGLMANDVSDVRYLRELGARRPSSMLHQEQNRLATARPLWKRVPSRLWPDLYELASLGTRSLTSGRASAAGRSEDDRATSAPRLPSARWKEVLYALAARYDNVEEVERKLATLAPETVARIQAVLTGASAADQRSHLELMALLQPRHYRDIVHLPATHDRAWKETTGLLSRIATLARRGGAKTVLAYIPIWYEVDRGAAERLAGYGYDLDPRILVDATLIGRLREFGAEAGIPVVDLRGPLRARVDEGLYFPHDGHWTPRGHRVAAEVMAVAIERAVAQARASSRSSDGAAAMAFSSSGVFSACQARQ